MCLLRIMIYFKYINKFIINMHLTWNKAFADLDLHNLENVERGVHLPITFLSAWIRKGLYIPYTCIWVFSTSWQINLIAYTIHTLSTCILYYMHSTMHYITLIYKTETRTSIQQDIFFIFSYSTFHLTFRAPSA